MANTLVQFRMEETARIKAAGICERLGIDVPTYLRICMARLIEENGVPFSMTLENKTESRGLRAMKEASRIAETHGNAEMTLEEINAEINAAREEGSR